MKCKHPRCRRRAGKNRRECHRCRMRTWRARNPVSAAWNIHKAHAKERGVPVQWTREEFVTFCRDNNFPCEGKTIERCDCNKGYCLSNCVVEDKSFNDAKGAIVDRWLKKKNHEQEETESNPF